MHLQVSEIKKPAASGGVFTHRKYTSRQIASDRHKFKSIPTIKVSDQASSATTERIQKNYQAC